MGFNKTMTMEDKIKAAIVTAIKTEHIEVLNESYKHKGHPGDNGSGETHFKLKVVSSDFIECNRVQRQRLVNAALHHLFEAGLHAVSVVCLTLKEFNE